jgi:hypothetical protein
VKSPTLIERIRKLRRGDPNVVGQACALTAFMAVIPGHEDLLEMHLSAAPMAFASPWAALRGLHFLRLHIVREFVHQGPSQRRDPLNNAYLVTDASFDGSFPAFVRDMCLNAAGETGEVYGHCVGFPGTKDPAAFERWIEHNRIENGTVLIAYPDSTVADVRAGLEARERVAEFAAHSHGFDAETLQREFRTVFPTSVWSTGKRS